MKSKTTFSESEIQCEIRANLESALKALDVATHELNKAVALANYYEMPEKGELEPLYKLVFIANDIIRRGRRYSNVVMSIPQRDLP